MTGMASRSGVVRRCHRLYDRSGTRHLREQTGAVVAASARRVKSGVHGALRWIYVRRSECKVPSARLLTWDLTSADLEDPVDGADAYAAESGRLRDAR